MGDMLLQVEEPMRVTDTGQLIPPQLSVDESQDDLEMIVAALDMDTNEDEEDEVDEETERERGEKIIDVLIPPCEWEDEGQTWIQRIKSSKLITRYTATTPPTHHHLQHTTTYTTPPPTTHHHLHHTTTYTTTPTPTTHHHLHHYTYTTPLHQQHTTTYTTTPTPHHHLQHTTPTPLHLHYTTPLHQQHTTPYRYLKTNQKSSRVRDEAAMTMAAFQSLFVSASSFGSSKAVQAEAGKSELETCLTTLQDQVAELQAEVRRLQAWKRQVSRRWEERREVQMSLFTEELECLERSEKQYQVLIETLLSSRNS
ncbi:hypothetical protein Pcinc_035019 [Petrolisthes cinctipes]|uniref:Uncharacterized protein n=1 Tax=Petrolisthes cinctipes TaxID=88211 RepID=A0AAE1EPL1_PETCI|nr:hypothetical protein Pcinc_035019 [Petrolisthes cinctipes]